MTRDLTVHVVPTCEKQNPRFVEKHGQARSAVTATCKQWFQCSCSKTLLPSFSPPTFASLKIRVPTFTHQLRNGNTRRHSSVRLEYVDPAAPPVRPSQYRIQWQQTINASAGACLLKLKAQSVDCRPSKFVFSRAPLLLPHRVIERCTERNPPTLPATNHHVRGKSRRKSPPLFLTFHFQLCRASQPKSVGSGWSSSVAVLRRCQRTIVRHFCGKSSPLGTGWLRSIIILMWALCCFCSVVPESGG